MATQRGFVLINALVLVLALSTVAIGLLALTQRGQSRLATVQSVQQATLYADAAEALVQRLLEEEWDDGGTDHLGEAWATPDYAVPIGRGAVAVAVSDLDGRFNLNLLTAANGPAMTEFGRLLAGQGLAASLAEAVAAFRSGEAASRNAAYLARQVPIDPPGGTMAVLPQLRQIDGVSDAVYARLAPYVATLAEDRTAINVNTAPAEVLMAVIPALDGGAARAVVAARSQAPFSSGLDFMTRTAEIAGADTFEGVDTARFAVRSAVFEAEITVRLGDYELRRVTTFLRDDAAGGRTRIAWRWALP